MAKPVDAERKIFRYHDGTKQRAADPLIVFRAMLAHPDFELEKHVPELIANDPQVQSEASQIAVKAAREIFGLPAWSEDNPDGLTELEALEVLGSFVMFADSLKKNGSGQPT